MAGPLIATKLHMPLLRNRVVERPRLRQLLDRAWDARLTVLSAPPGFGKTTLLAEWLARSSHSNRAIAWLSLDGGESEPSVFWPHVVTAIQTALAGRQVDFPDLPEKPGRVVRRDTGQSAGGHRNATLPATYRDAPFLRRHVSIAVDVQRFRCPDCKQAFLQDLPGMDGKRRMTARCASYILDQVMTRSSMGEVARIVGVDEKTIRNVFDDRGLIFSVGDPPSSDRFVCQSCLGVHPRSDHRLAPAKHLGRWRADELLREANVCKDCFDFASDPWRAGMVRRLPCGAGGRVTSWCHAGGLNAVAEIIIDWPKRPRGDLLEIVHGDDPVEVTG